MQSTFVSSKLLLQQALTYISTNMSRKTFCGIKSIVLAINIYLLVQHSNYTVGDFMTRRDNLHVVQPTTPVDQGTCSYSLTHVFTCFLVSELLTSVVPLCTALELLVQHRISGFPVVDDDWNLVSLSYFFLLLSCIF